MYDLMLWIDLLNIAYFITFFENHYTDHHYIHHRIIHSEVS